MNENASLQDQLNALYVARFIVDPPEVPPELASLLRGPDLVWIAPPYLAARPRVMLIGQQPDGMDYSYGEFVCDWTVERALESYRRFNFGERYYASPWWDFYNKLRRRMFGTNSERGIVGWSNLVKFVTRDREPVLGKPFEEQTLGLQGDLFTRELSVLAPDISIFASGPDYDRIIKRFYPGVVFEDCGLGSRTLARLRHAALPGMAFRTYHPKALRLQGKWEPVFDRLFELIDGAL